MRMRTTVTIPDELYFRVVSDSEENSRSVSGTVNAALKAFLARPVFSPEALANTSTGGPGKEQKP